VTQQLQSQMESPFETPRDSKRLFELVQPNDPMFRIAFYYALKDTLVC
jgi:structural maintenance of chromosome 4